MDIYMKSVNRKAKKRIRGKEKIKVLKDLRKI